MKSMKCTYRATIQTLMTYGNPNDVVNKIFKWHLSRLQSDLEMSMRGSDFIFDSVQLLHYNCHYIHSRRSGWYVEYPDWIKTKKQQ